jgi:hypothetical protein
MWRKHWFVVGALAAGCCAAQVPFKNGFWPNDSETVREYRLLHRELTQKPKTHGGVFDEDARRAQAFHPQATILPGDRDPLDIVLRRTRALFDDLSRQTDIADLGRWLDALDEAAQRVPPKEAEARLAIMQKVCAVRREIAFANPLLKPLSQILFITREALPPDEFNWGVHMCDQFFGFHATLHGTTQGNGLYVLEAPWSDSPRARNLLSGAVIEAGARKGQRLGNGGYLSPDVSFDGGQILFAYTDGEPQFRVWNDSTVFHLFRCNADGSGLVQLTDGNVNDFDPCWLPNGRIAFISERRGGFGRCHRRNVPTFTLHSMFEDGADIVALSVHETNEWQPSVDNNGMIVYTRWDYVDRGFNQAHHPWITYPDGRDARELNGNTHLAESTAPHLVADIRAIPGSSKYVAVACGHHTESRGSLIIIDPSVADDGAMAQIKRLTPDQLLPEAEYYGNSAKGSAAYATPWPLSETYYLCVYDGDANAQYGDIDSPKRRYALALRDAFGNKIPLYTHPQISCLSPMPLHPRPRPPVVAHGTLVGLPRLQNGEKPVPVPAAELPKTAKVGLVNVYNTRRPFPGGTRIAALRVWQILPKALPIVGEPRLGVCDQTPGRQFLGTVPVEADGSAYFEAPVGVPILFHAVDGDGLAVQGMRSVTYVAPGETLMCNGCHDQRTASAAPPAASSAVPSALKRAASALVPGPEGSNPYNYPRLVQPVLDAKCASCHGENRKEGLPDLRRGDAQKNPFRFFTSFYSLVPRVQYFTRAYRGDEWFKVGVQRDAFVFPYTEPGKFGAYASPLYAMLAKGHHDVKLSDDERLRLVLFMDSNASYFGHDHDIAAQAEGRIVPPILQ